MQLHEYLNHINELVKKNPEALNYEVYFASDSEGNNITLYGFGPSIQYTDKLEYNIDIQSEQDEEYQTPIIVLN